MIIVFGSNVLDLFFQQENLPPKDKAIFLDGHIEEPGGKGANQAIAAARAGAKVCFYGALGEGGHGRKMYKNLARNNIDISGTRFFETPSGLATIFVDETDGTHRVVVSQGANLLAKHTFVDEAALNQDTILLVQGELPMAETAALIKRTKQAGGRSVMNFAPAIQPLSEDLLHDLSIIILNEYEAEALGGQYDMAVDDKAALAQMLEQRFALITIITLGAEGSITAADGALFTMPALAIESVDSIGAGDAFTGYICAALERGADIKTAVYEAGIAGSLTCTKVGAQTALPYRCDVQQEIEKQNKATGT